MHVYYGGIDSAQLHAISQKKIKSYSFFSAYSKDKNYDESKYIDELRKKKIKSFLRKVKKDNKDLKIIENIINRTGNELQLCLATLLLPVAIKKRLELF